MSLITSLGYIKTLLEAKYVENMESFHLSYFSKFMWQNRLCHEALATALQCMPATSFIYIKRCRGSHAKTINKAVEYSDNKQSEILMGRVFTAPF